MSKYIKFNLIGHKPKTYVYQVVTKRDTDVIGEIRWLGRWRQYCFFPASNTAFSKGCLMDIEKFMVELMEARKR